MGQQRIGRYEVLDEIAARDQATVYRARDFGQDRIVALKVLHPDLSQDTQFRQRFVREVGLAAAVSHPNVIKIYEVGEDEDRLFIAMEYLPGSLHDLIQAEGTLSIDEGIPIILNVASALIAAHERGIVHRVLKPRNILLTDDRLPKVSDFGIARATHLSPITATGQVIGSPQYMSPEQFTGEPVDIRSDLYSLGVVLFEMLTGHTPLEGSTPQEVMNHHIKGQDTPLGALDRMYLDENVKAILRRLLAMDEELRFQTPAELTQALEHVVTAAPTPDDRDAPPPQAQSTKPSRRKAKLVLGVTVLALVSLGAVIAANVLSSRDNASQPDLAPIGQESVTVVVDPNSSVALHASADGRSFGIQIPEGNLNEPSMLTITASSSQELRALPSAQQEIAVIQSFTVELSRSDGQFNEQPRFENPVTVWSSYTDTDLPKESKNPKRLTLLWLNGASWEILPSEVDTTAHILRAYVHHLSVFGIGTWLGDMPIPTPTAVPVLVATSVPTSTPIPHSDGTTPFHPGTIRWIHRIVYKHYLVSGKTTQEIFDSMEANGPSHGAGPDGSYSVGSFEYILPPNLPDVFYDGGACRIQSQTIELKMVVTLPEFPAQAQLSLPILLRERWQAYEKEIKVHEQEHLTRYRLRMNAFKFRLERLPDEFPDCASLENRIVDAFVDELSLNDKEQSDFDEAERQRIASRQEPVRMRIDQIKSDMDQLLKDRDRPYDERRAEWNTLNQKRNALIEDLLWLS